MNEEVEKEFFDKMQDLVESIKSKVSPKEAILLLITYTCNLSYCLSKEKETNSMKEFLKESINISYDTIKRIHEESSEM